MPDYARQSEALGVLFEGMSKVLQSKMIMPVFSCEKLIFFWPGKGKLDGSSVQSLV